MYERERRPEARAVPEGERMGREEPMATITPMARGAYVPAWYSRISWGAVLAGALIAIALQIVLTALVTWIGLVATTVTTVAGLQDVLASIGIWTAISALVSLFVGAYAASRLGAIQFTSDGLWHGAVVWATALVAGILLTASGVTGLLGFGANLIGQLGGVLPGVTVTPQDVQTIAESTGAAAGWFLLGSLLALAASLLGGWLGSRRQSRSEAMEARGRERAAA